MNVKIESSWKEALKDEFIKPYFKKLADFVKEEYKSDTVYPPPNRVFAAFDNCPVDHVKVVILGQDPYHGPRQANGLAFSVSEDVSTPPSLQNIYKEIESDTGKIMPKHGNLERWAKQGVLLLNATLTVRGGSAGSHQGKGWEEFTDTAIKYLAENKENLVFLLWGSYAQKKGELVNRHKHLVLEAPHPSPFSADKGFFGCRHFTKTNAYLIMHEREPIEW
ncbi:uracil-DNA glycosylase [Candidatus Woesebacteria bacterium RIFCSPHIGHO2_01_FULL_44_21]|uniref:Uracil-DNA glycosylase n=1 Tax=Candidatus Woesebacteria bacterium RIFCSPHIGHO2_01_FULL_44_21 TaxID=1802503 RepID=A0A1F7Z0D3_9BACT|nr:MAG: uracil-DNA glycosylase [Candidatus Woesebacteria bacterium RIFCSPHIGHO2_01_FULL_44_21]OGM71034.1 MAG: uracil-DNA glycosylase [Candidatus Woesebacteria bacterium RIFCSPLOWO2_01_FULL_44_24b]